MADSSFASSTQLKPYDRRDAELGALVGFAWQPSSAWRAKLLASYYGSATSAEVSLRAPWRHRLAASAGVGHYEFSDSVGGYTYWSASGMVDLAPWLITVAYVNTDAAGKALFYTAAAHDRWAAMVIWRF